MSEINIEEHLYKIPLRNKNREIIDYALVSEEDFERVNKHKWCIYQYPSRYKVVRAIINKKNVRLSHFVLGKPENRMVVDHINRNSLDNRKENLRFATLEQNSQNSTPQKNTSSKYKGVFYKKICNKWQAECKKYYLGIFAKEIDAAKAYDTAVYILYGKDGLTNNLIKYEDTINLKIEDIIKTRKRTNNIDLPNYIYKSKTNKYFVEMTYNKKKYLSGYKDTIEEAIKYLDFCKRDIEEVNKQKELEHLNKEITRNSDGEAVIYIYNKNKEKILETIIDEELWYELSKVGWYLNNKYISGTINGKTIRLHRYLLDAPDNLFVDHIDGNPLNNKKSNLRLATKEENSYNKIKYKNTIHQYKGITYIKKNINNPFYVSITKDTKNYTVGHFDTEIKAAIAYNIKAKELFGEFANLNEINIDNESYNEIEKEVLNKISNKQKLYIGTTKTKYNTYRATYQFKGKSYHLGCFDNEVKCALAYNLKKIELNNNNSTNLKLNELNLDNETYEKYKKEIYELWSNI